MRTLMVTIRWGQKWFKADWFAARFPRKQWQGGIKMAVLPDNGALISCGLTVGQDGLTEKDMEHMVKTGQARELDPEQGKHSGCLSRCILRGDDRCQW